MRIWTDETCEPHMTPWRHAEYLKPSDGDTFTVRIDVGYDMSTKAIIRLGGENTIVSRKLGVDTFETRKERQWGDEGQRIKDMGLAAKDRTTILLARSRYVRIWSRLGGSRGSINRWVGVVLIPVVVLEIEGQSEGWVSIGDLLIKEKHAVEWWKGRKKGSKRPEVDGAPKLDTWSWKDLKYDD